MILGRAHMEKHYADLSKKPFFKDLVDYMISGPVVCMVWEGLGAVKCGRMMLGETNPQASLPGSIRGDMSIQVSVQSLSKLPRICPSYLGYVQVSSSRLGHKIWFRSDVIFATVLTPLNLPRLKSPSGSRRKNWSTGIPLLTAGSMKTRDFNYCHIHWYWL